MPRRLRFIPPGALVEVTTRTVQSRELLRPSEQVNDVILGIIGRAQTLFPVRIHALVFLSNHWHGLLSVDDAAQLASFMAFVNGNVAREIGRLHDWPQRFWERRYTPIVVADDAAAVERLRYILLNGCKEGLVDRPINWPGISCVRELTGNSELRGTWYDRTAEFNARRRNPQVTSEQFRSQYQVHLSPLPCWSDRSAAWRRAACAGIVAEIEAETRAERIRTGKPCLGRDFILTQHPHNIPAHSARSPAPLVHASTADVKDAFRRAYLAFVDAFYLAAACLRRGEKADFPEGAFPPRGPFVAITAAPA